jgi:hypothetical protein
MVMVPMVAILMPMVVPMRVAVMLCRHATDLAMKAGVVRPNGKISYRNGVLVMWFGSSRRLCLLFIPRKG